MNFFSFASSSFFFNLRKITWLNYEKSKTRGHVKNSSLLTFTENVGLSIAPQAIKDLQIWPPLTSFTWLLKTAIVLNTLQVNTFEKGHCYQRICTEILHSNTQSPYWDFESRVFLVRQLIFRWFLTFQIMWQLICFVLWVSRFFSLNNQLHWHFYTVIIW